MKLLLISLQKSGAAPRDALEFSNALCELKIAHQIIISSGNELRHEYRANACRTVKIIPTFSSSLFSFFFWTATLVRPLRLAWLVLRFSPDIVFTTHFHPWLTMLAVLAGLRHFEWYCGAHENPFSNKEKRGFVLKRLEQAQLRTASVIVCYSEFSKAQIEKHIFRANFLVLPLGAYSSALAGAKIDPRFANKNKPLLVCPGRIEPYKQLGLLIEAFTQLKQRGVSADLLIAGRGEISDELKSQMYDAGIMLENRWLSAEELTGFVMAADIIVLPYAQASQSGVIPLALAVGCPVVATAVGGIVEQIDDGITGKLVTPGNSRALADALEELLKNPDKLSEMGLKARVLGSTRLSWKRAGEIFLRSL